MCDPISLTVASTLATVGGSLMSAQQQSSAVRAQKKANDEAAAIQASQRQRSMEARSRELARQDQLRQEAEAAAAVNVQAKTPEKQQEVLDTNRQELESQYTAAVPLAQDPNAIALPTGTGQNQVVRDDARRALAETSARLRTQIAARSFLDAFGRLNFQNEMDNAGTNRNLQLVNNVRNASARVGQQEQDMLPVGARNIQAGGGGLGELLTGAGQFGAYAGGRGLSPFGNSTGKTWGSLSTGTKLNFPKGG